MKRRLCMLLVFFSSVIAMSAQDWKQDIDSLIQYDLVESLEKSFSMIPFSDEFINKFNLNEKELELIGCWLDNDFIFNNDISAKKAYVNLFYFLPNRIIEILIPYLENQETRKDCILFCKWKVEGDQVKVLPLYILYLKKDDATSNNIVSEEYKINSTEYKVIGTVEQYEKAYVQQTPFSWDNLELEKINPALELPSDVLRYRIIFEPSIRTIYQRIGTKEVIRNLLLNPQYEDPKYLWEVCRSH